MDVVGKEIIHRFVLFLTYNGSERITKVYTLFGTELKEYFQKKNQKKMFLNILRNLGFEKNYKSLELIWDRSERIFQSFKVIVRLICYRRHRLRQGKANNVCGQGFITRWVIWRPRKTSRVYSGDTNQHRSCCILAVALATA